ncbi:MAG: hypothetical protein QOE90_544 [Thermoplasmata archaeon]|jgi:hypothetical protein|nr:hypothetical protein [Thermoplasmata archaeon]
MSSKLFMTLLVPLVLVAMTPAASASVPMGVCARATDAYCPGTVCVWIEAKYICETPILSLPPHGDCTELKGGCPPGDLACVWYGAVRACAPDICYDAPEWCNPTLA